MLELGRNEMELQLYEMLQQTSDAAEYGVIQVPSLVEITEFSSIAVCSTPGTSIVKITPERLNERDLAESIGALPKISMSLSK